MELIIIGFGLIGLIALANVLVKRGDKTEQRLFHIFLFLLNLPVVFFGLVLAVLPADVQARMVEQMALVELDFRAIGRVLLLTAVWGGLASLTPLRRLLARIMPLDPQSPVHTLALVLSGYLLGYGAITLSQGGLEGLVETAQPASLGPFVISELLFAVLAFAGVGFLIRRPGRDTLQRLGLTMPKPAHLLVGTALIPVLIVLQTVVGLVSTLLLPEQAELLENVNTLLLGDFDTVWEWFILALAAGVGEEILFRGALQPALGIGVTSILFALVHVQYGFTLILVFFILYGIVIGLVRRHFNTTTAIYIHVGYDFALGLFILLAAALEQSAS